MTDLIPPDHEGPRRRGRTSVNHASCLHTARPFPKGNFFLRKELVLEAGRRDEHTYLGEKRLSRLMNFSERPPSHGSRASTTT